MQMGILFGKVRDCITVTGFTKASLASLIKRGEMLSGPYDLLQSKIFYWSSTSSSPTVIESSEKQVSELSFCGNLADESSKTDADAKNLLK